MTSPPYRVATRPWPTNVKAMAKKALVSIWQVQGEDYKGTLDWDRNRKINAVGRKCKTGCLQSFRGII